MKHSKIHLLAAALSVALLAGLTNAPAADKDDPNAKPKNPAAKPATS